MPVLSLQSCRAKLTLYSFWGAFVECNAGFPQWRVLLQTLTRIGENVRQNTKSERETKIRHTPYSQMAFSPRASEHSNEKTRRCRIKITDDWRSDWVNTDVFFASRGWYSWLISSWQKPSRAVACLRLDLLSGKHLNCITFQRSNGRLNVYTLVLFRLRRKNFVCCICRAKNTLVKKG